MKKHHKAHLNSSTGQIFDYTLDTFENVYPLLWFAGLSGAMLAVILFLAVVYVL